MKVGIYAGSIRPGGGLTVLKQVINALADTGVGLIIYTGESDSAEEIRLLISQYDNVIEKRFLPGVTSAFRYLTSKFYFLFEAKRSGIDVFFSINYYIPTTCRLAVYHINLLSFQSAKRDGWGAKIKRLDARLACSFAKMNIFESEYLSKAAMMSTLGKVVNPQILYIGVDPDFHVTTDCETKISPQIAVISSIQEHKDNITCLETLRDIIEQEPVCDWKMIFAGGQDIEQWAAFSKTADAMGLKKHVQFLGPVNKKDLRDLLSNSVALMSASRVESFCMVALESMSAGCPVVVTNATSMPESVGGAGILVNPGDFRAFTQAILSCYKNPEIRENYIKKGKDRAAEFSLDKFAHKLKALILET